MSVMRRRAGCRLKIRPILVGDLPDGRDDPGLSFGRNIVSVRESIDLLFNRLPENVAAFEKWHFFDFRFDHRLHGNNRADEKHDSRSRNSAELYEKDFQL